MILSTEKIPGLIEELRRARFYGVLSLQFRDGEVTLVKREETLPTDKSDNHRGGTNVQRDRQR